MKRACDSCSTRYEAQRPSSRYCGDRCRKRAQRGHAATPAKPPTTAASPEQVAPPARQVPSGLGALGDAAYTELHAAGKLPSSIGQAALALAWRIDNSEKDTGSAYAALVREFRAAMVVAVGTGAEAADPLDELQARRKKRVGA